MILDGEDWVTLGSEDEGGNARFVSFEDLTHEVGGGQSGSSPLAADVRSIQDDPEVTVVLRTGADVSVLPLPFKHVGRPLSRTSVLRDAQGGLMRGGQMHQAHIVLEDDQGQMVQLRESFALSNVSEPLLALGKLLRRLED